MRIGGVLELGQAPEPSPHETAQQFVVGRHGPAGKRDGDHGTSRRPVTRRLHDHVFAGRRDAGGGGKSILESRGDLGKLLFTASAGPGHASDTLSALEAEADAIYRKQAHGTELALLKKRLAELKSKKDAIDTLASTYEALEAERRDATERYEASIGERSVLSTRLETIAKHLRLIPDLADIRRKGYSSSPSFRTYFSLADLGWQPFRND